MSEITIADRRPIMTSSMRQPDFRDLLRRDPRTAVQQVTGRPVPDEARISVVEEQADAWEFVLPSGGIDPDLPSPNDARSAIENDVYALLREEPQVRARVIGDPKGFLAERLRFDIGETGVNVREERPGEIMVILPFGNSRDELNEGALDLVVGGGDPDCVNSGSAGREPVKPSSS